MRGKLAIYQSCKPNTVFEASNLDPCLVFQTSYTIRLLISCVLLQFFPVQNTCTGSSYTTTIHCFYDTFKTRLDPYIGFSVYWTWEKSVYASLHTVPTWYIGSIQYINKTLFTLRIGGSSYCSIVLTVFSWNSLHSYAL